MSQCAACPVGAITSGTGAASPAACHFCPAGSFPGGQMGWYGSNGMGFYLGYSNDGCNMCPQGWASSLGALVCTACSGEWRGGRGRGGGGGGDDF